MFLACYQHHTLGTHVFDFVARPWSMRHRRGSWRSLTAGEGHGSLEPHAGACEAARWGFDPRGCHHATGCHRMPPDATRCHRRCPVLICVDYWRLRRLSCGVEEYFLSLTHDFAGVGCPYDLLICCRCCRFPLLREWEHELISAGVSRFRKHLQHPTGQVSLRAPGAWFLHRRQMWCT